MTIFGYISVSLVVAVALALPSAALLAQPAVAPSTTIRVIEVIDPWTQERVREVAEDLTGPEISRIQRALASVGFDPGRATGRMNSTTLLALGRFQASRGLVRCECVSYETVIALGIRPLVVATIAAPVRQGYGSDVLVFVPQGRRGVFVGHQPAVVVGHGPSVFVGHEPARGAGEIGRRPPVGDPRPPRPRPGPSISGSGASIRVLTPPRPQPRVPFPGSANSP
jgi:hypothetical protein